MHTVFVLYLVSTKCLSERFLTSGNEKSLPRNVCEHASALCLTFSFSFAMQSFVLSLIPVRSISSPGIGCKQVNASPLTFWASKVIFWQPFLNQLMYSIL